jgi:KaiC/GvpD/RAD55 family RecA-like ATPase
MTTRAAIKGLDLVLAGGLRTVRKLGDARASTVALVRGAAGTGKTIFASHLAISEATRRGGDLVYCCIELLPTELDAQLSSLTFGPEQLAVRVIHGETEAGDAGPLRIWTSIIDIPVEREPDFGDELRRSIEAARTARLDPKVLVIDSLSEGYRLGGDVSRPLADALSKFAAEEGLVLVLIEEVANGHDSLWTFIADVVFELSHHGPLGTAAAEHRSLVVRKSRFGPSHVGPHSFTIQRAGGVEIHPRLGTYLDFWVREIIPHDIGGEKPARWNMEGSHETEDFPEAGEVVLVTGTDAAAVAITAKHLQKGVDVLFLDLDRVGFETDTETVVRCGDPLLSGERLMSMFWHRLAQLRHRISAIVVGDLGSIRGNADPAALRRVLPVLVWVAHEAGLAVLLFETHTDASQATAIHLADTVIEAHRRDGPFGHYFHRFTSRRRGRVGDELHLHALS